MLKKILFSASVLALACFMSGCASSPATGYDLDNRVTNMRSTRKVSGEELRYVAQEAVKSILSNRRFENYLTSYKRTAKDEFDLPLLKLTKAQNRTDDPSLDMTALTDLIKTELINSGLVDVTMAEGTDVDASFAESRDLEYDDNFDQSTVAQRGTLQAATLVLRPRIISSRLSEGRLTQVIRTFVIDVADIRTGRIVFSFQKQLAYYPHKCIHCGRCADVCDANGYSGAHTFSREHCIVCGKCEHVCPQGAFEVMGKIMTVEEVLQKVMEDKIFYQTSGGGVTLSGGECMMQADFCAQLLQKCKENGLNTAVDTCGFAAREAVDKVLPYTDTFLYDVKAFDENLAPSEFVSTNSFGVPWFKKFIPAEIEEYAAAVRKVCENYADLLPGDTGNPPQVGGWHFYKHSSKK